MNDDNTEALLRLDERDKDDDNTNAIDDHDDDTADIFERDLDDDDDYVIEDDPTAMAALYGRELNNGDYVLESESDNDDTAELYTRDLDADDNHLSDDDNDDATELDRREMANEEEETNERESFAALLQDLVKRRARSGTRSKFSLHINANGMIFPLTMDYILTARHPRKKEKTPVLLTSMKGKNWFSGLF